MHKRAFLIGARLVLSSITLFALGLQAAVLQREELFNPFNYFGYFTNLSNAVAAILLLVSAGYLYKSRKPLPKDDIIRGAATLYMTITGVVYVSLLIGEDLGLLLPWVNVLLHIVMPIAVVADWLYQPPLSRITVRRAAVWLLFPGLFLAYTLIRGAIVGWYPYPFLNPGLIGGYGNVALYCLGILGAFVVFGWLIMILGNALKRRI